MANILSIRHGNDIDTKCRLWAVAFRGSARRARALARELSWLGDMVIADIRGGDYFRKPSPGGLQTTLWKRVQNNELTMGWAGPSAIYGPVLEFGPKKSSWMIYPGKSLVSPGFKRSGQKTKYLRFPIGNAVEIGPTQIRYARKVRKIWKASSKRPHFKPALAGRMAELKARIARRLKLKQP